MDTTFTRKNIKLKSFIYKNYKSKPFCKIFEKIKQGK